jgi:hypothetical protein
MLVTLAYATDDVVSAVHGTIETMDSASKTIAVKTVDGAEHTFRFLDETAVHGGRASESAAKDSWGALREGTEVVVHYTRRGTEDTALEIDKVGREGLKVMHGTIEELERGGKKLVVKADDGTRFTFKMTDRAAKDAGSQIVKGTEKGAKVTVYYSEAAGEKIAHCFENG